MIRTRILLALCLMACPLAGCAGSVVGTGRPPGLAATRTTAVPARLTSGGSTGQAASMLILGVN